MRVKQVLGPLGPQVKLVWDRLTFSRLTTFYFTFSLLHFAVQLAFQIRAFTINAYAANFLWDLVKQGNAHTVGFPVYTNNTLRFCTTVPKAFDSSGCQVRWNGTKNSDNYFGQDSDDSGSSNTTAFASGPDYASASIPSLPTPVVAAVGPSDLAPPALAPPVPNVPPPAPGSLPPLPTGDKFTLLRPTPTAVNQPTSVNAPVANNDVPIGQPIFSRDSSTPSGGTQVILNGFKWRNATATLDRSCLWVLNQPVFTLDNTKREDIVFIAFQFWVLGMSIVALLNESIPHILASLLTHLLATAWSTFQIFHTQSFKADFSALATNGACAPINLLPTYWGSRQYAEWGSLALNVLAFCVSCFLSWRLVKLFGWQTFKRVGASVKINRVYKLVLTLSIIIQLSMFFILVTVGLWVDQLFYGAIGSMATMKKLYRIGLTIILVLLIPWLLTGWFAIRRESRTPMFIFLFLCVAYLGTWGAMFASETFKWTWVSWTFFGMMASTSVVLTLICLILGIICRCNFGSGLSRHLQAQEPLAGEDFAPTYGNAGDDIEKVQFPSTDAPMPAYVGGYGDVMHIVPAPHMIKVSPPTYLSPTDVSAPSLSRTDSQDSGADLDRQNSQASTRSDESNASLTGVRSKRWVIE